MRNFKQGMFGATLLVGIVSVALLSGATAPAGRYTVANGTVYDSKTKLTWQQTISGSTYSDANATAYCSAITLNGAVWRLPTIKELVTIVDFSVAPPASLIDTTAFVGTTPTDFNFESSTPFTFGRWSLSFGSGQIIDNDSNPHYVRCVH